MRVFTLITLLPFLSFGQLNLVPNGDFESTYSCPPGLWGDLAGGGVLMDWYNPNTATPDYFNKCAIPVDFLQSPHSDSAYVGLATFDGAGTNIRDYVSCNILNTLQANQSYWVEFYASVGEGFSIFSSNNLGIYFSDTALYSNNGFYFDVDAQIKYFNNEIIEDTTNWTKVSGIYQANGGEQFLTIGNFNTDAETMQGMVYSDGWGYQTYFLIDDVSVIPLDSIPGGIPVDAGPDKTIYIGDTTFIGQKISNMPDMWFELNGTPVDTNTAGVYVSPTVNTTYVVTRNLNGFYSTDTVTVFVTGVGLEENEKARFIVYPVPNDGSFHIKGKMLTGSKLQIVSNDGKIVHEQFLSESKDESIISTDLNAGVYLLVLKSRLGEILHRERLIVTK